jgi:uncharacterized protein
MREFTKTSRNQVKRLPERAAYDQETVFQIIDEALICHVGFAVEGQPYVIPTIHARQGEIIYLHGAPASRMLKHIAQGNPLSITFTLLDGLVLARSVFHHSMNYRSAVVFGSGRLVTTNEEKVQALAVLTEHVAKGRWAEARQPNPKELNATTVIAVQIESASAKQRSGGPKDDEADYAMPIWAGVLPLVQQPLTPQQDERQPEGVEIPAYLRHYKRK